MRLERLRRVTPQEIRWRASVALRTGAQRLIAGVRTPRWNRSDLSHVLAADTLDAGLRAAIAGAAWQDAHEKIAQRLRSRPTRFVLDTAAADGIREAILARWPDARRDAAANAERILQGQYDLLGYHGLCFARERHLVDWHFDPVHGRSAPRLFHARVPYLDPAIGDHKIIWEINRHQHWLRLSRAAWLTGDRRYGDAIVDQLDDWLAANPPLVGINWASMLEIALRAIAWTWTLHALLALPVGGPEGPPLRDSAEGPPARDSGLRRAEARSPWLVDLLVALDRQLAHVEQHLSYYFSPNTHLLGEALALYVVGTALPELRASRRFAATGRRILLDEIDRQILADGGHAERSAHYQRYTLDFYLLALLTARRARDDEAASRFADAVGRLAAFTRAIADDDGRLPLLGDDDGGMLWRLTDRACRDVRDSLSIAALVLGRPDLASWDPPEETAWLAGHGALSPFGGAAAPRGAEAPASRALVETGYVVVRGDRGDHGVLDAGAHGYLNGGHAHADALALTLSLEGRPLLVDRGTATYTMQPVLRDRLRSSLSHNTVVVDGRSQSIPAGPFHWRTRADARLDAWRRTHGVDWAQATHDGYAPIRHRRTLVRTAHAGWLIADEILGTGRHTVAAHWHFDPAWEVRHDAGRLRATHADGTVAWLLHDGPEAALVHGDPHSGLGWHAPVYGTLVPAWTAQIVADAGLPHTIITWIGSGGEWPSPSLQRLEVDGDPEHRASGVLVRDGERRALFLLQPEAARAIVHLQDADVETDAQMLHCVSGRDRLLSMDIIGASRICWPGWLSIHADDTIADLHVSFEEGAIDLQASTPPAALRLHGPLADGARLLIHAADWRVDARSGSADSAMARLRCGFC